MGASPTSCTPQCTGEGGGSNEELLAGTQVMMQMFELQKANFEESVQEVKDQIFDALDSLGADADDLKERTKAIEEATANSTTKTGEQGAAIDALENRVGEVTQRLEDKIDKLESFSKRERERETINLVKKSDGSVCLLL